MELIYSIDFAILDFIQAAIKNFVLDPVMLVFSYMGDKGAVWIIIGLIMLLLVASMASGACGSSVNMHKHSRSHCDCPTF